MKTFCASIRGVLWISTTTTLLIQSLIVSSSYSFQKIMKPNWDVVSKNEYNNGCNYNSDGVCAGTCLNSTTDCVEMMNYDTKVCGCTFCKLDVNTNKCEGQCSNLLLGNCVNRVANPTSDSDCECASCKAEFVDVKNGDTDNVDEVITLPSCDASTCFGNPCIATFVATNGLNRTLECICWKN
jgi:hypothetical protein